MEGGDQVEIILCNVKYRPIYQVTDTCTCTNTDYFITLKKIL